MSKRSSKDQRWQYKLRGDINQINKKTDLLRVDLQSKIYWIKSNSFDFNTKKNKTKLYTSQASTWIYYKFITVKKYF